MSQEQKEAEQIVAEEKEGTAAPESVEVIPESNENLEIVYDENADDMEEEEIPDLAQEVFVEHSDAIYCVAFCKKLLSNGCVAFASGSGDEKAILYHVNGEEKPKTFLLEGHKDSITSMEFAPSGEILATGGMDGVVLTWDTLTGQQIATLSGPTDSIEWVSFHPSPGLPALVAGDADGNLWLWNAKTGKCVKTFSNHVGRVVCGGFRSDGAQMWSAGEDNKLHIWTPKNAVPLCSAHGQGFHERKDPITAGCASPNGALIVTGDVAGVVKVTRFNDGMVMGTIQSGESSVEAIQFSPDGKWIAIAAMGGALSIWDSVEFKLRHACVHPAGVTSLRWHPTQPFVVTGCVDGAVRIWDYRNGALVAELTGNEDIVNSLDVRLVDGSQKDLLIVTGSEDTSVRLFSFVMDEASK